MGYSHVIYLTELRPGYDSDYCQSQCSFRCASRVGNLIYTPSCAYGNHTCECGKDYREECHRVFRQTHGDNVVLA